VQISAMQSQEPAAKPSPASGGGTPLRDLDNVFRIGDTLTENDKKLVGWDSNSGKINSTAVALASYRNSGAVKGEVSTDFVDAIMKSIAKSGGYPMNPAALMSKTGPTNPLSSETASALFALLDQGADTASPPHAQGA
jgi:hypothetical protein